MTNIPSRALAELPATQLSARQTLPSVNAKLHKAAEDFTAVALNELLKPIFDTSDTSEGPFGGGAGERAFRPMMINEIARQISRGGGLGLAEPVYQQMLRLQEGSK